MPGLPVISGDDLVKVLHKAGFSWDHTEGSQMILINLSGKRLSIPRDNELGRGLLRALIKDAGLTREEFLGLL